MEENSGLLQQFLLEANDGNKPTTVTLERRILSKFLNTANKPAKEIVKQDVSDYIKSIQVSDGTKDLYKTTIRKFFNWLYHYDSTDSSQRKPEVIAWIKVNRMKSYKFKTEADVLTKDEIRLLINHCDTLQQQTMISLIYDSAARIDEFTKLKIGDIVHNGDEISICVNGKTGPRKVPLDVSLQYLFQYLESHPDKDNRDAPLWLSSWNKQYTKAGIHRVIKQIAKHSKIQKRVTAHIFRHSRLTELAGKNFNEAAMRYFAGWSKDSTMPAIYIHMSGDGVLKALRLIEPKTKLVPQDTVEQQVQQRLAEEKQKIHDEVLQQLLETLKNPQSHIIQDYLFAQTEQP